jgi:hypothetical protein
MGIYYAYGDHILLILDMPRHRYIDTHNLSGKPFGNA